eukprot:TRINITY_DN29091_c0_g1_i1.p1 TRINITY_DN29091_c0_g1~~TRINITY_DN29091_c0_g1_i1.p1  ORF type:complete len:385 (-),score=74.12 TRINITY_DN29091_c0_g1_i1:58-1191(-)
MPAAKRPLDSQLQPEGGGDGKELVVLEYSDLTAGKDLKAEVAQAYGPGGLGICAVRGVPGLQEARKRLLPQARELSRLSPETLERYERPEAHYCVGWSRGREKFKGKPDDSKGSFYANPLFDDPADGDEALRAKHPYAASKNVWPEELPDLEAAFKAVGQLVYETAKPLVKQCDLLVAARHTGHGQRLSESAFTSRMCVGRLLHYFSPSPGASPDDAWCGWHNDNSIITGLVPAMWMFEETGEEASGSQVSGSGGLHVRARDRSVLRVSVPTDCVAFQIGEAAQILSGGVLVATPHQVRAHQRREGEPAICRDTFALFIEPQWDADIGPPEGVLHEEVLKDEEVELIPPLSKRLKRTPVEFGKYLADSFQEYYKHNN